MRPDLRGRGDSEGDGPGASLDDMVADASRAAQFLKQQAGCDHLAMLGICSGSNVAIGAATVQPTVEELALWSVLPFQPEQRATQRITRGRYYLAEYAHKALRPETWRRLLRGEVNLRGVGHTIAGERRPDGGELNLKDSAGDLMSEFARFKGRAIFIAGAMDPEGMEGRKVFQRFCRAKRLNAQFHLIAGANHSFYNPMHAEEAMRVTMEWFGP